MSDENEIEDERVDVTIFGVVIGTSSGWDTTGEDTVDFYDFEPVNEFDPHIIKCKSFAIDMLSGEITCFDENEKAFAVNTPMFLSLLSTAAAGKEAGK